MCYWVIFHSVLILFWKKLATKNVTTTIEGQKATKIICNTREEKLKDGEHCDASEPNGIPLSSNTTSKENIVTHPSHINDSDMKERIFIA